VAPTILHGLNKPLYSRYFTISLKPMFGSTETADYDAELDLQVSVREVLAIWRIDEPLETSSQESVGNSSRQPRK